MKWEDLVKFENLCGGAPLASIVFCCDTRKDCPFRRKALEILGISEEIYKAVKEKYAKEAEGTCYGNLAYCCSLNEQCAARDNALKKLGMSPAEYLQYKYKILLDLIPKDKLETAFRTKVLYKFAFEMVKIDSMSEGYRGLALGNPELTNTLIILDVKPIELAISEEVKETVRKSEYISVRVTREQYNKIAEIAVKNGCNMSDVVREALTIYLALNVSKTVKT